MSNPFLSLSQQTTEDFPLVALPGARNGYIMLAPAQEVHHYQEAPDSLLSAAKAWAGTLETLGSPRVYWITLSEVTRHLHIHLYPRWPEDTQKGLPLFEARDTAPQPPWEAAISEALETWADQWQVGLPSHNLHKI